MESVKKALHPLTLFTDTLSAENYASVSSVKPVLHILKSQTLAVEEEDQNSPGPSRTVS